jgi:TonB family protein
MQKLPALFALAAGALLTACASNDAPQRLGNADLVENRTTVKYYAADRSAKKAGFDQLPEPVGGMKNFVSRLDYPAYIRAQRVTGTMWIRVAWDAAGHVESAQVVQPLHWHLDKIVLRAIRETTWTPAIKHGEPVPYSMFLPMTFGVSN